MVRNQTMTSSITSSVSAELSNSLRPTISREQLSALERTLALPSTPGAFAWLLLAVIFVCTGLTLHVLLSVQIYQTRQQISQLQSEHQAIERQNAELVWAIAQHTALGQIRLRAAALGYEVPQARHYVSTPNVTAVNEGIQPSQSALSTGVTVAQSQAPSPPSWFDQFQQKVRPFTHWWRR